MPFYSYSIAAMIKAEIVSPGQRGYALALSSDFCEAATPDEAAEIARADCLETFPRGEGYTNHVWTVEEVPAWVQPGPAAPPRPRNRPIQREDLIDL